MSKAHRIVRPGMERARSRMKRRWEEREQRKQKERLDREKTGLPAETVEAIKGRRPGVPQ